jgi:hypothetical protein
MQVKAINTNPIAPALKIKATPAIKLAALMGITHGLRLPGGLGGRGK